MMTGRQRDDVGRAVLRLHESVGLFERVHEDRAFRVLLIAALNALDVSFLPDLEKRAMRLSFEVEFAALRRELELPVSA